MNTREYGTITRAFFGKESERGIWVVEIAFDFDGSGQSLQFCTGDEATTQRVEGEFRKLFGGTPLKGRNAFALRAFPTWNTPITGIEVDGVRVTRSGLFGTDELAEREASIQRDIDHHARRIREDTAQLGTIRAEFVDWGKS